jgi:short-subunit dehydrogenase
VAIPTGTAQNTDTPKINVLAPNKAAELIISGIEKNKSRIYVGNDSKFMNVLYRLSPGYATRLISKKMKSLLSH